ncbi:hypothetical protein BJ508DRAFT_412158 [Ascobolus immersus RN42]|uniref:F-box domain-containing protein n=1 Tax=Ascobolus immersus RN42 TaxID=1160509 RepID=A0A3N4IIC1_ASCIM|nr:hypothetical protein BJ508DRAFT_412158 [Ascobolus immersus RN42]
MDQENPSLRALSVSLPPALDYLREGTLTPPEEDLKPAQLTDISKIPAALLMLRHTSHFDEHVDPKSITELYNTHIRNLLPPLFASKPLQGPRISTVPILNLPSELLTQMLIDLPLTSLTYLRLVHPRFKAIVDSFSTYRHLITYAPTILELSVITNLGTHPHFTLSTFETLFSGNPICHNCGINSFTSTEFRAKVDSLPGTWGYHSYNTFYPEETHSTLKKEYRRFHNTLNFPNLWRPCCDICEPRISNTCSSHHALDKNAQELSPHLRRSYHHSYPTTNRDLHWLFFTASELQEVFGITQSDLQERKPDWFCYPEGLRLGREAISDYEILDTNWSEEMCLGKRLYRFCDVDRAGLLNPGRSSQITAPSGRKLRKLAQQTYKHSLTAAKARGKRFIATLPILGPKGLEGRVVVPVRGAACKGCFFYDFVAKAIDGMSPAFSPKQLVRPEKEIEVHIRECGYIGQLVRIALRGIRRGYGAEEEEVYLSREESEELDRDINNQYVPESDAGHTGYYEGTHWDRKRRWKIEKYAELILAWCRTIEYEESNEDRDRICGTMTMIRAAKTGVDAAAEYREQLALQFKAELNEDMGFGSDGEGADWLFMEP